MCVIKKKYSKFLFFIKNKLDNLERFDIINMNFFTFNLNY